MNRSEILALSDNDLNKALTQHQINYDDLPRQVRSRAKFLTKQALLHMPGDVAYDMAMNDKGAAIDRATSRADAFRKERMDLLRSAFADLLLKKTS